MASAQPLPEASKLDLLRRAYRVLKHDFDERERALATERAAHATAAAKITHMKKRAECAECELRELKSSIHEQAKHARISIQQAQIRSSSVLVPHPGARTVPRRPTLAGSGTSYQRGMEWADRVLSHATMFSSALSGSLESAGNLAVPLAAQERLEQQDEMIADYCDAMRGFDLEVLC